MISGSGCRAGVVRETAVRVLGDEERVIYEFRLWVGETEVLSGRAAVVLNAGAEK